MYARVKYIAECYSLPVLFLLKCMGAKIVIAKSASDSPSSEV